MMNNLIYDKTINKLKNEYDRQQLKTVPLSEIEAPNQSLAHIECDRVNYVCQLLILYFKLFYEYRIFQLHPDLNPQDPKTHDKFIRLKEAYTTISTPAKKKTYDKYLAGVQRVIKMKIKENDSENINQGGGMRSVTFVFEFCSQQSTVVLVMI